MGGQVSGQTDVRIGDQLESLPELNDRFTADQGSGPPGVGGRLVAFRRGIDDHLVLLVRVVLDKAHAAGAVDLVGAVGNPGVGAAGVVQEVPAGHTSVTGDTVVITGTMKLISHLEPVEGVVPKEFLSLPAPALEEVDRALGARLG